MSTIYIGLSYPNKFKIGAWLISKWIGRTYSHAYIRFAEGKISSTVYQASHGMVHFKTQENFIRDNLVIKEYAIQVSDDCRINVLQHCMDLAGEKYGYLELFKIFILDILNWANLPIPKTYDGPGYICSELVADIMQQTLNVIWDKPTYLLKPSDIEDKLKC